MGLFGKLFGKTEKEEGMKAAPAGMKETAAGGASKVKDLVCGMEIDPNTAAGKSEYMGKTYYFCSPGCKKAFDANPTKYVKSAG